MGKLNKNRVLDLEITALSKKCNGLAFCTREDGTTFQVEVPFTMPGDKIRAKVTRKRGGVYAGVLEEVITPSANRVTPRCIHFGVCGGCRAQEIPSEDQSKHKEKYVRDCFGAMLTPDVDFRPIVPSPITWHYRNKMEYSFSSDLAGQKYLGLVMDSSRGKVFNLTECYLTNHWFTDALKCVRNWWHESKLDAYHMSHDTGSLRTLTVREGQRTGDRMVVLTVSGNPDFALHRSQLETFVAFLRDAVEPINPSSRFSIFLRIQQTAKGMATNTYEMLLYGEDHFRETLYINIDPNEPPHPITFAIGPSSFFQPNPQAAEQLYSLALRAANIPRDAVVYDLYCGTGAFGICISKKVKMVIGVEFSPESALDARTNAKHNGCQNVTIMSGAVRYVLSEIADQKLPSPDVVVVDPPRPGLDPDALKQLLALQTPKILYVSCNPASQAANIAELLKNGYKLTVMQPFDNFPQTYHVENIAVLTRNVPDQTLGV